MALIQLKITRNPRYVKDKFKIEEFPIANNKFKLSK